jgi:hypothetical protein
MDYHSITANTELPATLGIFQTDKNSIVFYYVILHLAHEATSFRFVALSDHVDGYLLIQKGSLNYLTTKTQDFYNIVTHKLSVRSGLAFGLPKV